jgi:hypothetical protein
MREAPGVFSRGFFVVILMMPLLGETNPQYELSQL